MEKGTRDENAPFAGVKTRLEAWYFKHLIGLGEYHDIRDRKIK
jgi:hypothetical protein